MTGKRTGKPVGRPSVVTDTVLAKLVEGFSMSFSDDEASLYAGISPSTLYDYCKLHPEFSEQKEQLKKTTTMLAKRNMTSHVKAGSIDESRWWLERKAKDEFSTKTEVENTGDKPVVINIFKNRSEAEKNAIEPK